MAAALFRTIFAQPDAGAVTEAWDQVTDQLADRFPKTGPLMTGAKTEVVAFATFPRAHWQKIWSTNPLERINLSPGVVRVADRFHMQRLAAQALTEVRCRRQTERTGHRGRKSDPLWAARRDLLRARQHLTEVASERLEVAFRADCWDDVECAWTLKEMLADLYANADRPSAEAALADWHHHAAAFDIAETNRLARTLRAWEPELLAYFDGELTNGPTEGTNRIIKAVKRQGFGYTNAANYRHRVL